MLSRTGEQLQLLDSFENGGRPLLNILADPKREFYHYLAKFKSRRIYANVTNDRTVPYWTAAMDTIDYFEKMENIELFVLFFSFFVFSNRFYTMQEI